MSVPYPMPGTEKEGLYPSLPSAPLENPPPYTPTPDRNEIEEELHKIEDEISTLKAVLISKQERAAQLKRQLGMYGFDVAKDDMKRAAQSIANSKPYTTVKDAVTKQWNNVTNTNAYKSVNNSVSSFFKSVKTRALPHLDRRSRRSPELQYHRRQQRASHNQFEVVED
ncbi:hypothetical protein EGR_10262 [Echinococcus granulosus]|uniref:Tumor protein d52 n=1 Tax=Echinococcus granulosus TaxID=6210 RepID=W6UMY3_ECHGR|nr:hypothetical protein EGR_10262 [Echinococcus granulosus]EUB54869.1 hypothetical protein EGR_10262 [Echinococcus granulosus]